MDSYTWQILEQVSNFLEPSLTASVSETDCIAVSIGIGEWMEKQVSTYSFASTLSSIGMRVMPNI